MAFDMIIIYNDIRRMLSEIESGINAIFYPSLDDMLAAADCTLVATPFGGEKVLNASSISKMKTAVDGSTLCAAS